VALPTRQEEELGLPSFIHPTSWNACSTNFALKLSEKSRRRLKRGLTGPQTTLIGLFSIPGIQAKYMLGALLKPLFGQFLEGEFSEVHMQNPRYPRLGGRECPTLPRPHGIAT